MISHAKKREWKSKVVSLRNFSKWLRRKDTGQKGSEAAEQAVENLFDRGHSAATIGENCSRNPFLISTLEYIPFAAALFLLLWNFQPVDGWLGHDYYYSFIRLMIGAAHFWSNPFTLPHYTPSLCGGIPFFADPQSVYFSFPQLLTFFIDPVLATYISIFIFYCLAYFGCLKLFTAAFHFTRRIAHLSALLFILNGFIFAHLYVGHLTHLSYLLFPWVYYALLKPHSKATRYRDLLLLSSLIVYLFYAGAFHMLVVLFVGLGLFLPYLIYRDWQEGQLKELFILIGLTSLVVVGVCSGKMVASILFSKNFARAPIDSSGIPIYKLIFDYFWFNPSDTPLFIQFGKYAFGPWEYVGFSSRLMIPIFFLFILYLTTQKKRGFSILLISYGVLIPFVCILASGHKLNTYLPFFKDYHNPIKLLGAFFLPFSMLFGATLQWLSSRVKFTSWQVRSCCFSLIAAIFMVEFVYYSKYFLDNRLTLGYRHNKKDYSEVKAHKGIFPVDEVVGERGVDISGLRTGCTSLKCYEPLFGYRGESIHSPLKSGKSDQIFGGAFNLHHPGCLLYPDYFKCKAWDRIPVDDKTNFNRFREGKIPSWGIPAWHSALYWTNLAIWIGLWVPLLLQGFSRLKTRVVIPIPRTQPEGVA